MAPEIRNTLKVRLNVAVLHVNVIRVKEQKEDHYSTGLNLKIGIDLMKGIEIFWMVNRLILIIFLIRLRNSDRKQTCSADVKCTKHNQKLHFYLQQEL